MWILIDIFRNLFEFFVIFYFADDVVYEDFKGADVGIWKIYFFFVSGVVGKFEMEA